MDYRNSKVLSGNQDYQETPRGGLRQRTGQHGGLEKDNTYEHESQDYETSNVIDTSPAFPAFVEFPTPELLRNANTEFTAFMEQHGGSNSDKPYPTPVTKQHLFNISQYEAIDQRAVEVRSSLRDGPLQTLVDYLIQPCTNQVGKCRALFRWITAQDLTSFVTSSAEEQDTAHYFLSRIKSENGDYTKLFVRMCELAGLRVELVEGYSKGAGCEPGRTSVTGTRGTWAAVQLDGVWALVDPHWGSRHSVGGGPGNWELIDDNGQGAKGTEEGGPVGNVYSYNEDYFLTDPEEMVYYHLPKEADHLQLLARPVTLREFTDMAYLKPCFFRLGLKLLSHRKVALTATDGEAVIEIGLPDVGERKFMYRLWRSTKSADDDQRYENTKLERFVMMQQEQRKLNCRIVFPVKGTYKFELLANEVREGEPENTTYQFACYYVITADTAMADVRALPENQRKEWGPGHDLTTAGLLPVSHTSGIIKAEDGTANIRFKVEDGRKVDILHELHSNTLTKDELANHIMHHVEDDKMVINLKLPEKGDYALNLFAKDQDAEGNFPNVCSYLVSSDTAAFDPSQFPAIPNGCLGATTENKKVRLIPVFHKSPYFDCPESGELELKFSTDTKVDVRTELHLQTEEGPKEFENFCIDSMDGNKLNIRAQFPEPGSYALKIYAKERDTDGFYPNVFNFIVNVSSSKIGCLPFPKKYSHWGEGCELKFPSSGILLSNQTQTFEAKVPNASRVAVIVEQYWSYLESDGNDVWTGMVPIGGAGNDIKLSAEMQEGSGSFITLMTFEVKSDTDLKEITEQQEQLRLQAEKKKKELEALKTKTEQEFSNARKGGFHKQLEQVFSDVKKGGVNEFLSWIILMLLCCCVLYLLYLLYCSTY